ncbi:MAG: YtxH domain-containing protein [Anaerolineae bacterium]|nr:YtxH domain-containing protein [Anaerolineae bacterium]
MRLSQVLAFMSGLVGGAIVGAAVVALLAPQSGAETRANIVGKVQEIVDAGKQAAADRRLQLRSEYERAIRIPIPITESEPA